MTTPNTEQRDFEEEFDRAIADWRERHRLREDDAVLLLVELFRIHQRHWDELRHREMPAFGEFRADIAKLVEVSRVFHQHSASLLEILRNEPPARNARISRTAAFFAAMAALLAGYLIGRAWP